MICLAGKGTNYMGQLSVIGIDVSKDELVIFDTATRKHRAVVNNESELQKACLQNHWLPDTHVAGLESTGDYSLVPMKTLVELGFQVRLLNPILTQSGIKHTVRGTKTDATDSEIIAELTTKGEGQLMTQDCLDMSKKANIRIERKLSAISGNLKRLLKAVQLKASAGVHMKEAEQVLEQLVESVAGAQKQLWSVVQNPGMQNHLSAQEKIINSHVGCGVKLSAIISEEAGNIKRFHSARQLVAYAGIDPRVKQSGTSDTRGRMTKRGNNNLRHALYLAASIATRFDPELKAYFEKKRAEGKHYTVAVCAVARKMCGRIYSTVKQDRLYEKREVATLQPELSTKQT
jgi:transposase